MAAIYVPCNVKFVYQPLHSLCSSLYRLLIGRLCAEEAVGSTTGSVMAYELNTYVSSSLIVEAALAEDLTLIRCASNQALNGLSAG